MMKYTEKRKGKNVIPLRNAVFGIDLPKWSIHKESDIQSFLSGDAVDRLAELEDKIEQGKIIIPNFARNQEVYYIEYVAHAYPCPHCGEECYEEEVKGVAKGIICERIITDNQDGMDIWYTIQIEEKGKLKMFTKREEKEVFLTREEAEKRLLELQGDK